MTQSQEIDTITLPRALVERVRDALDGVPCDAFGHCAAWSVAAELDAYLMEWRASPNYARQHLSPPSTHSGDVSKKEGK